MGSSIPLPALAIQPPPNPVDQYAKMAQLKGLLQQEQTQQQMAPYQVQQAQTSAQAGELDLQQKQLMLTSQKAMMDSIANGDLNKYFDSSAQGSGSGSPVGFDAGGAYQHLISKGVVPQVASQFVGGYQNIIKNSSETAKNLGAAASDYVTQRGKSLEEIASQIADIQQMPPDQQGAALDTLKQTYAQHPPPGIEQNELAAFAKADPSHLSVISGLLGLGQKVNDITAKSLQAQAESQQKVTGAAKPTPQQVKDATDTVNTYGAIPPNMRQAFSVELANAPDFETLQKVQARADAANESFQRSADARQQATAMRDVGVQTQLATKLAGEDQKLGSALDQTAGIRQLLDMSKGGNQTATSAAQTRFAEHEIVEGGVKRMNEIEYRNLASSLGSYGRKFSAWADGGFKGEMPPATNAEMQTILDAEDQAANMAHDRNVGYFVNRFSDVAGMKANTTAPGNTGKTNAQPNTGGQPKPAAGMTRIKASDGTLHDVPTANLAAARKIDPGLQVVQ